MKHKMINGKLLNLDKTWRHLSMNQREWIVSKFREEYVAFLSANHRHPKKEECGEILDRVYARIQERAIGIPYGEVRRVFASKLSRYRKITVASKQCN